MPTKHRLHCTRRSRAICPRSVSITLRVHRANLRGSVRPLGGNNTYPQAFSRRRVEGVAAVSYDTAPWGAVGNVKVVASEPDEAFGEAARNAIANSRVAENDVGHRNCFRKVRFKLPSERSPS